MMKVILPVKLKRLLACVDCNRNWSHSRHSIHQLLLTVFGHIDKASVRRGRVFFLVATLALLIYRR